MSEYDSTYEAAAERIRNKWGEFIDTVEMYGAKMEITIRDKSFMLSDASIERSIPSRCWDLQIVVRL